MAVIPKLHIGVAGISVDNLDVVNVNNFVYNRYLIVKK